VAVCGSVGALAGIAGSAAAPTKSSTTSAKKRAAPGPCSSADHGARAAPVCTAPLSIAERSSPQAADGFITVTSRRRHGQVDQAAATFTIDESVGKAIQGAAVTIPAGRHGHPQPR